MLIDDGQQGNRACCLVPDTANNNLIAVEVVAVDLDAKFLAGLQP
jgi:hypothetical protein